MRTRMILCLVLGTCSNVMASAGGSEAAALNVLLSDEAGLGEAALRRATHVAGQILRDAGIATNWTACPPARHGGTPEPKCATESGPFDISIRLVAAPLGDHRVAATSTGMALTGKSGGLPAFAYVYYDRAVRVADTGGCAVLRVLGHVMAHETGHLLGLEHSWHGIMRAEWTNDQTRQMSAGYLLFAPEETGRLRDNVRRRMLLRRADSAAVSAARR